MAERQVVRKVDAVRPALWVLSFVRVGVIVGPCISTVAALPASMLGRVPVELAEPVVYTAVANLTATACLAEPPPPTGFLRPATALAWLTLPFVGVPPAVAIGMMLLFTAVQRTCGAGGRDTLGHVIASR
jgi:hypothetical protein